MRLFRINHLVQQVVEFFNAHFCLSEQRIIFSAPDHLCKDYIRFDINRAGSKIYIFIVTYSKTKKEI